jgi:Glycosyl hydrolase family 1
VVLSVRSRLKGAFCFRSSRGCLECQWKGPKRVSCLRQGKTYKGNNGHIAYQCHKEDVALLAKSSRVSVSWARTYPIAKGEINETGLQFACEIERLFLPLLPSFSTLMAQMASG